MAIKAKSAEAQLRKAVVAKLKAGGLPVSRKATALPRIEVTDVSEGGATDKDENVRELGFVVEAISGMAYGEAAALSDSALGMLVGSGTVTMDDFEAIDIYKELGQEIMEVGEADAIIIRRRTQYRANVARKEEESITQ